MLRANAPSPGSSAGAAAGKAIDATLSGLSLMIGIATLGGWSAKPVNIFGDGDSASAPWSAVERDADLLALHMVAAAGHSPARAVLYLATALDPQGRRRLEDEAARIDAAPSPELDAILRRLR
jgi:hypothetical protein